MSRKRVNPSIKTAGLTSHELGIPKGIGEKRDPLASSDKCHCEIASITSSHRPKFLFGPINGEGEKLSSSPLKVIVTFVELRTERPHGTAKLGGKRTLVRLVPHKRLQSRLRSAMTIERREPCPEIHRVCVDHRPDELVLGLEVVVDVAHRNISCLGDICERCHLDAMLMEQLTGSSYQPFPLAGLRSDFG